MKPTATIYLVTNTVNGKRYIGVTRFSVVKRWAQHQYTAKSRRKTHLHNAIHKYGVDAFVVQSVASCLYDPSEFECLIIKQEAPEYNQTNGGEITIGRRVSSEVVAKITAANTGKKRTQEQNAAMSVIKKAQYAARPELREVIVRNARKANELSARSPKRLAAVALSSRRAWSDESRAKLSASCMGRVYGKDITDKSAAKKRKRVECTTLGVCFSSALEAAAFLNVSNGNVGRVCHGERRHTKGLHFKFIGG